MEFKEETFERLLKEARDTMMHMHTTAPYSPCDLCDGREELCGRIDTALSIDMVSTDDDI